MNRLARVLIVLVLVTTLIGAAGIAVANYAAKNKKAPPPQPTPALTKSYSGILYKVEKKDNGGAWFTILVNEDKTIKKVEANASSLKVGDRVLLTVKTENSQIQIVDIKKQDSPLQGTVTGKVISFSEKTLTLNLYGDEITVNIGESAGFSYKYDKDTNTPGKQIEIRDFSQIKVGDYVILGIDGVASSKSLVINTVQILNSQ